MSIYEKLSAIQEELKAPKDKHNKFGDYNYRSCEDILEAAKPICRKHGTVLLIYDEIALLGSRYYIRAVAELHDTEGTEKITATAFAREAETKKGMDESQITGTASSYARKYALNGLFNIDDTKDADTNENRVERDARAAATRREPTQAEPVWTEPPAPKDKPPMMECEMCGSIIKPVAGKDGKEIPARSIMELGMKNHGKKLCAECQRKLAVLG